MKLYVSEPSERHAGPILVCDEAHNDIAEFFHNEHATVGQSYETALALAQSLVSFRDTAEFARKAIDKRISDGLDDDLGAAFEKLSVITTALPPACAACEQLPKRNCPNPSCAFRGTEFARF